MFLEALELMEKNYIPGHFFTGTICGNLGGVYYHQGQLGKARKLLNRALEIGQKFRGPDHPIMAIYMITLGRIHYAWKHFAKAESLYLKALDNLSGPFGNKHSKTLGVVTLLQELSERKEDREKTAFYAEWLAQARDHGGSS